VAFLQDEVERKGSGFYIPLSKTIFTCMETMQALTTSLGGCQVGMESKDADAVPAQVGRLNGGVAEQDIGKSIR